ncbi:MAG: glycogen synthase, partial [Clostridiaceae bacterium]|nr:glycogen synthase [Clostridiaceae bacterium]
FDPATDPLIARNYSADDYADGKAACKAALQKELGLKVTPDLPLVVMVSRLVDQKGLDLLLHVLDELLDQSLQLAVLGTGQPAYEQALTQAAKRQPDYMAACLTFDSALARRFYAGADLFLMPSLFEPCGLAQMIAMRYGTIPIVRETGGLRDTVEPYNQYTGTGNGFSFRNINAHELLFVTRYACDVKRHMPEAWQALVRTAMSQDFSWDRTAEAYEHLYQDLVRAEPRRPHAPGS